jgi:pimeloyl-ACP methyl ester carboxylesterase
MTFLPLNSVDRIYYETLGGKSEYPTLVFLHEGLGCQGMWKDFPAQVCRITGCPGLVYDRLGYGKSSPQKSFRTIHYIHEYALFELPFVIEQVIPDRPYVLIGHSDGGSISLIHAAERPAHLKGIITEAAHVFIEPITLTGIRDATEAFRNGQMAGLYRYHGEKTEHMFRSWSDTWLSDWFQPWNIEYLLPSITCPTMVIQGLDDHYGTKRQVDAIVCGVAGFADPVLLDGCAHSPHRDQPEVVAARMSVFIDQLISRLW